MEVANIHLILASLSSISLISAFEEALNTCEKYVFKVSKPNPNEESKLINVLKSRI